MHDASELPLMVIKYFLLSSSPRPTPEPTLESTSPVHGAWRAAFVSTLCHVPGTSPSLALSTCRHHALSMLYLLRTCHGCGHLVLIQYRQTIVGGLWPSRPSHVSGDHDSAFSSSTEVSNLGEEMDPDDSCCSMDLSDALSTAKRDTAFESDRRSLRYDRRPLCARSCRHLGN